jgi:hypothetical protein
MAVLRGVATYGRYEESHRWLPQISEGKTVSPRIQGRLIHSIRLRRERGREVLVIDG